MLDTAEGLHRAGIMSEATLRKITVRHLGPDAPPPRRSARRKFVRCANRQI